MAIFAISIMGLQDVKALEENFYEGDYAGSYYTRRWLGKKVKYQRSRFFIQRSTGRVAYCIEPFEEFGEGGDYTSTDTVNDLSKEDLTKLKLLAYYGYLYPGHEDVLWYTITQQAIWKLAEPNGVYEFTYSLNSDATTMYDHYLDELWAMVNAHLVKPSFHGTTLEIVENQKTAITDKNQVLNYYTTDQKGVQIKNNQLIIEGLKEGDYTINLTRKANLYEAPALFFYKEYMQKVMTIGNAEDVVSQIHIRVKKTNVEILKTDKDTESTTPTGSGKLEGAIYGIYNQKGELVNQITIGKESKGYAENIPYGTYTVKEIKPGKGYQLDKKSYQVVLDKDHTQIKLTLVNEIIKKKIKIHKEYGTYEHSDNEPGIPFEIYDQKGNYITTITTDIYGNAEVVLPFGTYRFKQKLSTPQYQSVDDFIVEVKEEDQDLTYDLLNYKIEIPDTGKESSFSPLFLLLGGIYVLKRKTV